SARSTPSCRSSDRLDGRGGSHVLSAEPPRTSRSGSGGMTKMRRLRSEAGTAMVEFALVALPLFLLVGGILDFARAMNYYNDMTQLAGQGARAAIVAGNPDGSTPNTATSVQCQLIKNYTTSAELKGTTATNGLHVQITDPNNAGA